MTTPRAVPSCAIALALTVSPALAVEFDVSAGYTITDSTNLTNTSLEASQQAVDPEPIVPGIRQSVDIALRGEQRAAKLDYDLALFAEGTTYEDNVLSDQVSGRGGFQAEYRIRPATAKWVLADYYFITADDLVALGQEDERNQSNAVITGPVLTYRINSVDSLNGEAFYLHFWNENDPDEELLLARTSLARRLNARQTLSGNIEHTQLLNADPGAGYAINNIFARLTNQLPRQGLFETDLGVSYNVSENDDGSDTTDSALFFQLRANQRLTRNWSASLQIGRSYTDSVLSQLSDVIAGQDDTLDDGNGVFLEDLVRLDLNRQGAIWGMGAGFSWAENTFEDPADDTTTYGANFGINYAVTGRLGFFANASYESLEFSPSTQDREDVSEEVEVGLSWQHTVAFRSRLGWRENTIESTGADGLGQFDEEATWYSLTWNPRSRLDLINQSRQQRALQPVL
ncbi:MAG: hypothetical protein AAGA11_02355 [Pseudomonadota bacterium]